jgi:hypothetical protein
MVAPVASVWEFHQSVLGSLSDAIPERAPIGLTGFSQFFRLLEQNGFLAEYLRVLI